jgi:serine/threonine protein kinase
MASKRRGPAPVQSEPTVNPEVGLVLVSKLIESARSLQAHENLAQSDIHAWNDEARDYLAQAIGAASPTINSVLHTGGNVGMWSGMSEEEHRAELKGQLENKIKLLNSVMRRLETSITIAGAKSSEISSAQSGAPAANNRSTSGPTEFETATERYIRVKIVGEGGAGRVFHAKDSAGRDFAIKCLHPRQATTDKRRRFRNELTFLRNNRHKNILTVIDDGLVDWEGSRTPFYVMPLYSATLRTIMQKGIPADQVLPMFSRILDGVEAAHLSRVTHRDIKPENVLVDEHNNCVVADFGIAHFEEEELFTAVETKANERLANFLYAAPEQRVRGGAVTDSADLFALGLILNEMFTGQVIQGTGFRRIALVNSSASYLDEIVDRLVQNSPTARYASIDELKKDLIAARNDFVVRQTFDAQSGQVVSEAVRDGVDPAQMTRRQDAPTRQTKEPTIRVDGHVESWEQRSYERFDLLRRTKIDTTKGDPFAKGYWQASLALQGTLRDISLTKLLDILASSKNSRTGWDVGWVPTRTGIAAYPFQDGIEVWLAEDGGKESGHSDFWRAEKIGTFALFRGYQEDEAEFSQRYQKIQLDYSLVLWRVSEFLLYLESLARNLGVGRISANVRIHWNGLENRRLGNHKSSFEFDNEHICRQSSVKSTFHVPDASLIKRNLIDDVTTITRPLFEVFNFFTVTHAQVKTALRGLFDADKEAI